MVLGDLASLLDGTRVAGGDGLAETSTVVFFLRSISSGGFFFRAEM